MTGKFHAVTDDYSSVFVCFAGLVFMEDLIMNLGPDEYVEPIDVDTRADAGFRDRSYTLS